MCRSTAVSSTPRKKCCPFESLGFTLLKLHKHFAVVCTDCCAALLLCTARKVDYTWYYTTQDFGGAFGGGVVGVRGFRGLWCRLNDRPLPARSLGRSLGGLRRRSRAVALVLHPYYIMLLGSGGDDDDVQMDL